VLCLKIKDPLLTAYFENPEKNLNILSKMHTSYYFKASDICRKSFLLCKTAMLQLLRGNDLC
jgi:hypothetical protein